MKTTKGLKTMTGVLFALTVAAVLITGAGNDAQAAYVVNDTESATVSVTISSIAMIDLTPASMDFGSANPGTNITTYTAMAITLDQFQVENVGSTNLTNVWFNVTQPTSSPFGTGSNDSYNAANYIALNGSAEAPGTFKLIDMIEYPHPTDIVYLTLPANTEAQGRFHLGPKEYFWALNSSDADCSGNAAGDSIMVGTVAHDPDTTGDIDLSDNQATIDQVDASNGVANVTVGGDTYCAQVASDCGSVRLYRFNADAPGAAGGACQFDGRYSATILTPGDSYAAGIQLFVPYGAAVGAMTTGTLTVLATSA